MTMPRELPDPTRSRIVVDEPTRRRHRIVEVLPYLDIGLTACGMTIVIMGRRHPRRPGHLIAYPACTCQVPVTGCCA